jgi:hypothetical protein
MILALWLSLASAQAQQTYTQPVTFQTSNQSMWNSTSAAATFSKEYELSQSWDFDIKKRSYKEVWLVGDFGGTVIVNTKGKAGLIVNAFATSGNVDVAYPITLNLTYPDPATLSPGQTFTVTSSWAPVTTGATPANLTTHSPQAYVTVRDVLDIDEMGLEVRAKAFSHTIIYGTLDDLIPNILFDPPHHFDYTLFDTRNLTEGSYEFYKGVLEVDYKVPEVNTSGGVGSGGKDIETSNSDDFLTFNASFSDALAVAVPEIPDNFFNGGESEGGYGAEAFLNWKLLDLYGEVPISLAQDFKFSPKTPKVTLTLSSGAPVTFDAGNSFQLTMPTDGTLTITPTVELDNLFTNRTYIKVGATLNFEVADVEAGVSAGVSGIGHFTKSVRFHPFSTYTIAGGTLAEVDIFNQAFKLGGFSAQTLPPFTLNRIRANDDLYSVTSSDGTNYTLDVPAPGILSNDTGPSGFHAIDQVGVTSDGKFAITLDTNGHFNFQGTKGTNTSYDIPYQITDNNGHAANATIHVTLVDQSVPLVANSDTYRATLSSDGTRWTLDVPAPGVLGNDSGPAGFHAVAYTLNNFFGATLVLNSDGSLHFSRPYVSGQTGRVGFLYQITDGVRTSPQAYIYVDYGG